MMIYSSSGENTQEKKRNGRKGIPLVNKSLENREILEDVMP